MTDFALPSGLAAGEFRLGHVLRVSWSVFSRNFLKLSLVSGIAALPELLLPKPSPANIVNPFANLGTYAIVFSLLMLLSMLGQAIVLHAAVQHMRRRPVSLLDGLKVALVRFLPLLGIGLLVIGALAGILVLAALSVTALATIGSSAVVLIPLGILAWSVPFLFLFIIWSVAAPACVVERLGPLHSLGRSRELTRGHRWKLLALILVTTICALLTSLTMGVLLANSLISAGAGSLWAMGIQIGGRVWNALWTALFMVLVAVTYRDLRVAKEGLDTDQIATVFE